MKTTKTLSPNMIAALKHLADRQANYGHGELRPFGWKTVKALADRGMLTVKSTIWHHSQGAYHSRSRSSLVEAVCTITDAGRAAVARNAEMQTEGSCS